MNNLNPEIKKILDDHNIDPAPKEHSLDNMFQSPIDQLEDLFQTFGRIFSPYEKKNNIDPKGFRKDQINKDKK